MPFFWGLWDKGFNWDGLQRFIAGYQRPTKHCARQERDLRAFAKKAGYKIVGVWKEIASRAKQERAERKKVLALAQARKVDMILVTELTSWGRSVLNVL
jgi:DNA invertase Pin-like site-specific DNA recombinase